MARNKIHTFPNTEKKKFFGVESEQLWNECIECSNVLILESLMILFNYTNGKPIKMNIIDIVVEFSSDATSAVFRYLYEENFY